MHASFDDIESILDLCQEAHDLSPHYQSIPSNRDKARQYLEQMILNPMMLVAYNDDGVLIGLASDEWWRDGLAVTSLFFYARKNGRALLKEYINWANRFPGYKTINLGVTFGGKAGERTAKLYERLGFERTGINFEVNVWQQQ